MAIVLLPLQWAAVGIMVLATPLIVVCGRVLYLHGHSPYFHQRCIELVVSTYILSALSIYALCIVCILDPNPYYTIWYPGIVGVVTLCQLITIRLWYQYVNIRKSQAMTEWKQHLNPEYNSTQFVLKYNHIIGQKSFLVCFFLLLTVLSLALLFLAVITGRYSAVAFAFFTLYILVGILFFAAFKFVDHWKIYWECRFYVFLVFLSAVLCVFMYALDFSDRLDQILTFLLLNHHFIMIIIATCLTPYFAMRHNKFQSRSNRRNAPQKMPLSELIRSDEGYELFMHHLHQEFSIENCLFLSIIIQFQGFLMKHGFMDDEGIIIEPEVGDEEEQKKKIEQAMYCAKTNDVRMMRSQSDITNAEILSDIVLAKIVPLSPIFKTTEKHEMKQLILIYLSIYRKYIERRKADLEVNISFKISSKLAKHAQYLRTHTDEENIAYVTKHLGAIWYGLQASALQSYALLSDSYTRFNYAEWERTVQ